MFVEYVECRFKMIKYDWRKDVTENYRFNVTFSDF